MKNEFLARATNHRRRDNSISLIKDLGFENRRFENWQYENRRFFIGGFENRDFKNRGVKNRGFENWTITE
jgi:hypothetical protein